jgi:hypothetical protein
VRGLLIAYGYSYPVASTLAVLMTEALRQPVLVASTVPQDREVGSSVPRTRPPLAVDAQVFHVPIGQRHCVQGAPTSPGICNALLLRLDHRLAGLAKKHGLSYTRYADDLTFSGASSRAAAHRCRLTVTRIIQEEGFTLNAAKTRLMAQAGRQTVTGVVVNQVLGLSRTERRRLRAMIHRLGTGPLQPANGKLHAHVTGKLAYLHMLNPAQAQKLKPL